jgi:hypothetical protein
MIKYDESTVLLYEDYKEPLKAVPKGQGYGYMGTIALSADRQFIQCHICGDLYAFLGGHLKAKHGTDAEAYKKEFGLSLGTALVGDKYREMRQQSVIHQKGKGLPEHLQGYNDKRKSGELKRERGSRISLEWRNKKGLCPEQVLEKILDLKEILGKVPSADEFSAHYKGRYIASITYQHGSWVKAVKKLGLKTRDELRHPDQEQLLQDLRDFKELHDRIPMTSDFNRGLLRDKNVYIRQFGTLNDARIEAGLNAVLALPFGQVKEVTPEEYYKYKDGHGEIRSKTPNAIRLREKRRKKRELARLTNTTEEG